jgi:hypothetical protein
MDNTIPFRVCLRDAAKSRLAVIGSDAILLEYAVFSPLLECDEKRFSRILTHGLDTAATSWGEPV